MPVSPGSVSPPAYSRGHGELAHSALSSFIPPLYDPKPSSVSPSSSLLSSTYQVPAPSRDIDSLIINTTAPGTHPPLQAAHALCYPASLRRSPKGLYCPFVHNLAVVHTRETLLDWPNVVSTRRARSRARSPSSLRPIDARRPLQAVYALRYSASLRRSRKGPSSFVRNSLC
ncbi:unnamed protein product [Cyclocybe aegerita]|uniref:Uncharacterized protein n=1 Tax=Cyclocybe aegerita TaxID=1973307 RepID=A0A8S0WMH6_CYCAE|nr:unnamed protein product [Cyclocybe aegerita]